MPKTKERTCADCPWMHDCPVDERWWGDKDGSGRFSWPPEATGECPLRRMVRVTRDAHRELRAENKKLRRQLMEERAKSDELGWKVSILVEDNAGH